jgi:cytochrome P450
MTVAAAAPGLAGPKGVVRLPMVRSVLRLRRRPLRFLESLPHCGLVVLTLGRTKVYLVKDPSLIQDVLVTQSRSFTKGGPLYDVLRTTLRNGLVTSDGPYYRRQRRLVQPAFHHTQIARYAEIMRDVAATMAASWHDGQRLAVDEEMMALAVRVATRTLFSADATADMVALVQETMPITAEGIGRRAYTPIPLLHRLPTPGNHRYEAAIQRQRSLIDRLVAGYRASGADSGDLLSMLLAARDEDTGEAMSDEQVHDECLTILTASTETTADTLSWAFHIMAGRPDIERQVHAEVDDVLDGRAAGYHDVPKLGYVRRLIDETLRCYPPVWLLTRRVSADVELDGHRLPAGTQVFFSPYAVHHDSLFYPDPDRVDPDRWLPDRARELPREAYLPFGAGTRRCAGTSFALTEAVISLATLAGTWRLRPAPGRPARIRAHTTLRVSPLPMVAERRHR